MLLQDFVSIHVSQTALGQFAVGQFAVKKEKKEKKILNEPNLT